jgi:peptidyl-prolyl cis-trans isomerase D
MISSFRRFSKTKGGLAVLGLFFALILVGFALGDIQNVMSGGFGSGSSAVAEAGDEELSSQELDLALRRRLTQLREQDPTAGNAAIARDFDPLLDALIEMTALRAFAKDQNILVSNRLLDAEVAQLPGARGLDGKFSDQSYQQFLQRQQMTDPQFRKIFGDQILRGLLLVPVAEKAKVPVGMARPYASMQMELRDADISLIPAALFAGKVGEPTDAQLATYFAQNRGRYAVPEQRVLDIVRIGPEQVASVKPTDKDVADYYAANQATYGGKVQRVISRAVVANQVAATALANKLKSGASFVDAVKPLGFSAADISLGPQTREEFARLTTQQVAAAVFANNVGGGSVVGPLRTDLGFIVVKVERIQQLSGKSLEAARPEILERLSGDKRKDALQDLVARLEDSVSSDGATISEAARALGLAVMRTPAITSSGKSLKDGGYAFPAALAPALKTGFELDPEDDPTVAILTEGSDYAMVGVDQLIASAPPPMAEIRTRLVADWKAAQARDLARTAAAAIAGKVAKGADLKSAVAAANIGAPPPQKMSLRRLQLAQFQGQVPPALGIMFSLANGRSRMVAGQGGQGFLIVKVTKIVPGDATLQPQLISQLQREFEQPLSLEYAQQFNNAVRADVGVKRNEKLIEAARKQYSVAN